MAEEDFSMVLSNQDYMNYLSQKQKYKGYEKIMAEMTETNEQLEKEVKLLKKSFYIKKSEVDYLNDIILTFIDNCNGADNRKQENEEDVYQNLTESNVNGRLSSIESYEMTENFNMTFKNINFELSKISELISCTKQFRFSKKLSEDTQLVELKPMEIQIDDLNKAIQKLLVEKTLLVKESSIYKDKVKTLEIKIEEYEYKMFNNPNNKEDKAYFIKLLIDEYNRELQLKLMKEMKLPAQEVDSIVLNQLSGISEYISNLLEGKLKKNKGGKKK